MCAGGGREREVEGKGDGGTVARHQRAIIGRQVVRGSIFRTMPAKPYGRRTGHLLAGCLRAQRADLLTSREPRIIAPFRSLRVRPALITATPPTRPLSLRSIGKNLSFPLSPPFPPSRLNHLSRFFQHPLPSPPSLLEYFRFLARLLLRIVVDSSCEVERLGVVALPRREGVS